MHIHCEQITKQFGDIIANNNISCDIHTGGIHAFLGENGAGKSTLMKILAGYYQPDSGSIAINDNPVVLKSPVQARQLGIGMVHQQFTLVPSLTVLENILLGHPSTPVILNAKKQAAAISDKAVKHGIELDLYAPISRLNMAQRQKVEILKLLWRDARILILDEPTSQLTPFEAEEILQTMTKLSGEGKIVILITHHIEELLKFASVITLLRRGKIVNSFVAGSIQAEELARLMIGEKTIKTKKLEDPANTGSMATLVKQHIKLQNVNTKKSPAHRALNDINLEIEPGEVHGIAGMVGSGQDELAEILCGHLIPENGQLFIEGKEVPWTILKDDDHNCAYIPAEPKKATLADLTLWENLLLRNIHRQKFLAGPFIRKKKVTQMADERIAAFDVRPAQSSALGGSLSGGNLQRLILAREFHKPASLLVAVNPTAGLDLAMSLRVREELKQYVASGRSVLLISPDMDELLRTCDRISVMFAGNIISTETVSNLSSERLGLLMGGKNLAASHKGGH